MDRNNTRKSFIDIAKGIGIILVALGHLDTDGQVSRELIYSFHLPLFFIISGALASKKKTNFKDYFQKNFKTLYVPYLVFVVIDTVLFGAIHHFSGDAAVQMITNNALALAGFGFKCVNRPVWFLFALFFIKTVFYFVSKNKAVKYITAIACVAFVFFSGKLDVLYGCLYLMALPGLFFYMLGSEMRACILKMDEAFDNHLRKNNKQAVSMICVLGVAAIFVLLTLSAHKNGSIDMTVFRYHNAVLYFANSILGSFFVLAVSVLLAKLKFIPKALIFYGRNSIIVMLCHYYLCRKALPAVLNRFDLSDWLYHPITQAVVLILIMAAMIPVIMIANKYFYFIFGKSKRLKNA